MAKAAGRLFIASIGATAVAGVRDVSMTVNGTPIDVTDQDDANYNSFLSGELIDQAIEISISGLETDGVLQGIALGSASGKFISNLTLDLPTTGTEISGDFVMSNYSETGPYKDAQTFTATFTSDGAWTAT